MSSDQALQASYISAIPSILSTLQSIDQRLLRIETALRVQGPQFPPPLPPPPNPVDGHAPLPPNPNLGVPTNLPNGAPLNGPIAYVPLEPPPEGYTVSSRATMQEELDHWTLPRGYSMRIAGAKVTGKKKVRWVCYRGGEARNHRPPVDESVVQQAKAEGRRKPYTDRASKKCGCLFKFELVETGRDTDLWILHYPNPELLVHNHPPSASSQDPRARKLPALLSAEVDGWLRDGWQVRKIQAELKERGFTNVLDTDLYNRKRILQREAAKLEPTLG